MRNSRRNPFSVDSTAYPAYTDSMSVKVKSAPWLPNREHLERQYGEFMPSFETLLERLDSHLKSCITVPSANFKGRVKGFNSYYRKLLRTMSADGVKNEEFPVITDIIGIRIVCAFLQDLVQVEKNLQDCFTVLEVERKGADRTFREFGYESTHILLAIPRELKEGLSLPRDLIFEIQVRTILQDAWAEVEHELVKLVVRFILINSIIALCFLVNPVLQRAGIVRVSVSILLIIMSFLLDYYFLLLSPYKKIIFHDSFYCFHLPQSEA